MSVQRSLHISPPFRAEHVGSLLRPAYLYKKRLQLDDKRSTKEDLKQLEDKAIRDLVTMQRTVGIGSITDGEMRRYVGHITQGWC